MTQDENNLNDEYPQQEIYHEQHILPQQNILPYLKKGDSYRYVDQFLYKPQTCISMNAQQSKQVISTQIKQKTAIYAEENQSPDSCKSGTSPFHNFQKHLTVALKNCVQIKLDKQKNQEYIIVAQKLWKIFKRSNCTNKKILHYLLCAQNQHKIEQKMLKQYGMEKVYHTFSQETLTQARKYLAYQTILQIKQGKIQKYVDVKKLKDKNRFKKYVQIFVQQLQNGYLRKRLPQQKVLQLLKF